MQYNHPQIIYLHTFILSLRPVCILYTRYDLYLKYCLLTILLVGNNVYSLNIGTNIGVGAMTQINLELCNVLMYLLPI